MKSNVFLMSMTAIYLANIRRYGSKTITAIASRDLPDLSGKNKLKNLAFVLAIAN
jgi:hypothetical protein